MSDFQFYTQEGLIGHYQSCKVLLIVLNAKARKDYTLIFARINAQAEPVSQPEPQKLGQVAVDNDHTIYIFEYDLDLPGAELLYTELLVNSNWVEPSIGDPLITDNSFKSLPVKYTPTDYTNRDNKLLAANNAGSYWQEFFNEPKQTLSLLHVIYTHNRLADLSEVIFNVCRVNLNDVIERLGNVIFQFPVTVIDSVQYNIDRAQNLLQLKFFWPQHGSLPSDILVQSFYDNSLIQSLLQPYNGNLQQQFTYRQIGEITEISVYRNDPRLLIYRTNAICSAIIGIHGYFALDYYREFAIDGQRHRFPLKGLNDAYNPLHHRQQSKIAIDQAAAGIVNRHFYSGHEMIALDYVRQLISEYMGREIYLMDPYLTGLDILNTLYFSPINQVKLRAIGDAHSRIPNVDGVRDETEKQPAVAAGANVRGIERRDRENAFLTANAGNNAGIDLEFRMRLGNHGRTIHDRYLIFPGSAADKEPPRAYSLGISVNNLGGSYHTIAPLQDPQSYVDHFRLQWGLLADASCLVYKYPIQ